MRDTGEGTALGDRQTQRERRDGGTGLQARERREEVAPPSPDVLSQLPGVGGWAPCPRAHLQGKKRQDHVGSRKPRPAQLPAAQVALRGQSGGTTRPWGEAPSVARPPTLPGVPPAELGHCSQPRLPDSSHS